MKNFAIYDDENNLISFGRCSTEKFNQIKEAGEKNITSFIVKTDIENVLNQPKKEFFPAIISKEQWQDVLDRLEKLECRLDITA
ncbi:MAG: hypothetical protein JW837_18150 [Sedimentisphaerales bacterium]|nr:hypothetical protein [Sedimentisphaerales bacterium]